MTKQQILLNQIISDNRQYLEIEQQTTLPYWQRIDDTTDYVKRSEEKFEMIKEI